MNAILFAAELLKWLPAAKAGVTGAWEALEWGKTALETMVADNRDPTDEEWQEVNARTDALREALHSD